MAALSALVAGLLLGSGLLLSRMCDPNRVLAFLDVAGHWNPALAFTMAGAIAVAAPAFWYVRTRRPTAWDGPSGRDSPTTLPDRYRIDWRLIAGSAIFGVGWGLAGICPGPELLLLMGASVPALVFAGGMVIGIYALGWRRSVDAPNRV